MQEARIKTVEWINILTEMHIPRWDELPDFDLYSDQVVSYIEKELRNIFEPEDKLITTAMMHNYAKLDLMPKPEKKRYCRTHVAYLLAITILKQVLEISDIRNGIILLIKKTSESEAYNLFCDEIEYSIKVMAGEIFGNDIERREIVNGSYTVRMAAYAFAGKILAKNAIKYLSLEKKDEQGSV